MGANPVKAGEARLAVVQHVASAFPMESQGRTERQVVKARDLDLERFARLFMNSLE